MGGGCDGRRGWRFDRGHRSRCLHTMTGRFSGRGSLDSEHPTQRPKAVQSYTIATVKSVVSVMLLIDYYFWTYDGSFQSQR